jgi:hypothetical protein
MKNLIFILTTLLLVSCAERVQEPEGEIKVYTDSADVVETIDYSNPAIIAGSDFGSFFQELYKLGDYETMLSFTSSQSIDLHGEEAILNHYKNMQFGYELGDLKTINKDDYGINSLMYESNIQATDVITKIDVVIENDSCKVIVYQDLEDFPLRLGYNL